MLTPRPGSLVIGTLTLTLTLQLSGLGTFCPRAVAAEVPDLKQQLETGLKARRPAEFEFIATVVQMVELDLLPLPLVQSTFLWARSKRPYPFVYFHRGLIRRARQIGIEIPSPDGL